MKTAFIGFQRTADSVIRQPLDRARIVAAAVAIAAANRVSLPTSPVDDAASYYSLQALHSVESCVSEFNENLVFDLNLCLQLARQFWMTRYRAAHPSAASFALSSCSFFETLFGVPLQVSDEDVQFLNVNKMAVLQLGAAALAICHAQG